MLWYRIALSHRIEMRCVAWHDMCVRVYIAAHYHCTHIKLARIRQFLETAVATAAPAKAAIAATSEQQPCLTPSIPNAIPTSNSCQTPFVSV